jgi:hypothetical protein
MFVNEINGFDGDTRFDLIPEYIINAPSSVCKRIAALKKIHLEVVDIQIELNQKIFGMF